MTNGFDHARAVLAALGVDLVVMNRPGYGPAGFNDGLLRR